jgi:MFS family permease
MSMRSFRAVFAPPELGGDFTKLWSASAVSNLGDGAMLAAGPLLVASITTEPAAVAAAMFVQQLPWLLFALFSGALVDRLDRRRVVVAADTFRGVVLAALAVAVALGTSPLWAVYAVLFLLGTSETLADNAGSALLVTTVPKEQLGRANARLFATFTLGNQLAGPPIGAWLFAVGNAVPLGLDAVSFLVAAVLVARIGSRPAPPPERWERLSTQVKEGVRWLWRHPGVRTLAVAILVMNITFSAAFATWVLFARERLGLSEAQFGLLITAGAVGGLTGAPVYHWLEPRIGSLTLLRVGLVVETVTHLVLALTRNPYVAGITMAIFGVHAIVWGTVSTTARQLATPTGLLGRVNSVYLLASIGGSALGALVGGGISQEYGLAAPFAVSFVAMTVVTVVAWRPLRHVAVRRKASDRLP